MVNVDSDGIFTRMGKAVATVLVAFGSGRFPVELANGSGVGGTFPGRLEQ